MRKFEYIGKEPVTKVGGLRVVTIKKGDIVEASDRRAQVYLRHSDKWKPVKEKPSKKEGKE